MKLPTEIKKAIRQGARHYQKGREQNMIVRDWLDSIGRGEDDHILDMIIDGMENGYDPDFAIKAIQEHLTE